MTDEELQAIRTRAEAATPGPWTEGAGTVAGGEVRELVIGPDGRTIIAMAYGGFGHPMPDCTREDRAFIAAARTDVPALLAEVERLRAERDEVEALLPAVFRFVHKETGELALVEIVRRLLVAAEGYQRLVESIPVEPDRLRALLQTTRGALADIAGLSLEETARGIAQRKAQRIYDATAP